jgi:hypothetical protein
MKKKKLKQLSIHDYLGLGHQSKIWFMEFAISDFDASLSKLLELPQEIYQTRKRTFFLAFMNSFLQRCEIGFILRNLDSKVEQIELALLGYWEESYYAIPLWIMNDLLLGFEVIPYEQFKILDSELLTWPQRKNDITNQKLSLRSTESNLIILDDDFFQRQNQKIYFKLQGSTINLSRYFNELELFDRIARTKIPEIDELDDT